MTSRPYKDLIIYGCFVLNRLVAEMGIDLYQEGLDAKLALVLPNQHGLSKEEVKREIKSNHFMTDRVIESLEKEGHATVEVVEGHYRIRITREGVLHIRRFNEFYRKVYQEQIRTTIGSPRRRSGCATDHRQASPSPRELTLNKVDSGGTRYVGFAVSPGRRPRSRFTPPWACPFHSSRARRRPG